MIVIDQPETESIHFPTSELQLSATQSTLKYFMIFYCGLFITSGGGSGSSVVVDAVDETV